MNKYAALPPHMQDGMQGYIEQHVMPGDFLQAVLENDLMRACDYADIINREELWVYASFLYNVAPTACYGSREKVAAWVARKKVAV